MTNQPCTDYELQTAAPAQPTMVEYVISDRIVLAGQPQPADWSNLVRRGFNTVINIRSDPDKAALQARAAEAAGLRYIYLPLPAYELGPEHLATFNEVINRAGYGKILFHCRTATRTGLLWLLKRTSYDGWSQAQAEAELRAAGYDDEAIETFQFCAKDYFERAPVSAVPA
jgi:uncharacterized protein (TIGR01244 family)